MDRPADNDMLFGLLYALKTLAITKVKISLCIILEVTCLSIMHLFLKYRTKSMQSDYVYDINNNSYFKVLFLQRAHSPFI